MCNCNLCKARELKCHPFEVYFGLASLEAEMIRVNSTLSIDVYEGFARAIRKWPSSKELCLTLVKKYDSPNSSFYFERLDSELRMR